MNPAQKQLFDGALRNGVLAVTSLFTALPLADPMTFNFRSLGGFVHMLGVLGWVIFIAECQYFKQWAQSPKAEPKVPASAAIDIKVTPPTEIPPTQP